MSVGVGLYRLYNIMGVFGTAFLSLFLLLAKTKLQSYCLVKQFLEKISKTILKIVHESQKLRILAFRKSVFCI